MALAVGDNVIKVKVTAADGTTTQTYTVTVTRAVLAVSVVFGAERYDVTEGESVTVTVNLSEAPGRELTLQLTRENGDGVNDADLTGVPPSVTFAATAMSASFTVMATDNDVYNGGNERSVILQLFPRPLQLFPLPDGVFEAMTGATSTEIYILDNEDAPPPPPSTPTGFGATAGDAQVVLSWDKPASDADITLHEYRQKMGTGNYSSTWNEIPNSAPGGANDDGYTVTELSNSSVAYTFELRAVNDGGKSQAIEAGPVTPMADTPATCTLNTGDLWCGVMTVAEFPLGPFGGTGRGYRFSQAGAGSLTDNEFPYDGATPYRVQAVYYLSAASQLSYCRNPRPDH